MLIRSGRSELGFSTELLGAEAGRASAIVAAARRIGLRGVEIGPAPAAEPVLHLAAGLRKEGIEVLALRAPFSTGGGAIEAGAADLLADQRPDEAREAFRLVEATAAAAKDLRCRHVIVRPGAGIVPEAAEREKEARLLFERDPSSGEVARVLARGREQAGLLRVPYLERAVRALWKLTARFPDITFCMETPGAALAMPDCDALEVILDELKRRNAAYWHDTGHSHVRQVLGGEPQDEWLERFGAALAGVHLHDAAGVVLGLPPGTGDVDFHRVRESLPAGAVRILKSQPGWSADIAEMAVGELRKVGL